MFRTNKIIVVLLICLLACANVAAQEGVLITQFDYTYTHGLELLSNDVNDDLLLLYVFSFYDSTTGDVTATDVRIVHLQRDGDDYVPKNERTVFETTRQIQQLDWTYDPKAKKYLIALLNGERYGDERDIRLVPLDLSGKLSGSVRKLPAGNFELNFPQICAVPSGTANAPAQARYLYLGRAWIPETKETGIVTVFLNANAAPIGQLGFSIKENFGPSGKPLYEPEELLPSGDKKGFLLACRRRSNSDSDFLPTVVRFNGNAKYTKHLTLADEEAESNFIAMQQVSKKKFAVAWADNSTLRFWSTVVSGTAKKAKTAKLVSEQPACTSDFDAPYPFFCKPDGAKKASLFFAGDKSDPTAYSVLMKKNGKTSNHHSLNLWNSSEVEAHWGFDRWIAAAPILGTSDIFCAVTLRMDEGLEVYGFIISGN